MKSKALIITIILSTLSLSALGKVDCSDPKNRPRDIGGTLMGGGKSVIVTLMLKQLNAIWI